MRNIELQKKTIQTAFEKDLENGFADYEDMLKRKKELRKEFDSEAAQIRERIEKQQEKIK